MADLFDDIVPSILRTKKDVLLTEQDVKDYKPWIVNQALSFHKDCVYYANEMNMHRNLDPKLQYLFLLNMIRPMKRKFQPWQKSSVSKDLECVKEYFGYSNAKAKEALRILTIDQIAEIKRKTDKGGVKK